MTVEDALALRPYVRKIVGKFRLDLRDEEECVQDAIYKLATAGVQNYDSSKASILTYAFRVARNEAIRWRTHHAEHRRWQEVMRNSDAERRNLLPFGDGGDGTEVVALLPDARCEDALDRLVRLEQERRVRRATRIVLSLRPAYVSLLRARVQGQTLRAIAAQRRVSVRAVHNQEQRALRLFRDVLGKCEGEKRATH